MADPTTKDITHMNKITQNCGFHEWMNKYLKDTEDIYNESNPFYINWMYHRLYETCDCTPETVDSPDGKLPCYACRGDIKN